MTRVEAGGIITGFLFRAALLVALLGLVVYESGAIIVAHVAVDGVAQDAAREAELTYDGTSRSAKRARAECETLAERAGATCDRLTFRDGAVTATVTKRAPTVFAHRIGALERFTNPTATHSVQIR